MPTYDYRCDRCERTFEVRQRISEAPLTTCERCGGPIRRLLSAAPFILKGGGWYVTDYPSEGRKKGMEAEKKSSGDAPPSPAPTTSGTDGAASSGASRVPRRPRSPPPRPPPADRGARPDSESPAGAPLPHEHLDPVRAVDQGPERVTRPLGIGADQTCDAGPADAQDAPRRAGPAAPSPGRFVSRFP